MTKVRQPLTVVDPEKMEFPPVPEDRVWCGVRGKQVGVSECAGDGCVAPEMREVCWLGREAWFVRHEAANEVP